MKETEFHNIRQIAKNISMIENRVSGFELLLEKPANNPARIIGITGAPGSGKSTLTDALIHEMIEDKKRVAVLCIDPSSPFNRGAILGDRIRMSEWYNHPEVFIRSLASRGSLGGLHPFIMEITEYVKNQNFDFVIIETVGVGQSEVDIAALADITVVVLVPESGDTIQNMKSGLMEIADLFVVNKSDREGAETFYNNLKKMLGPAYQKAKKESPVFKVVATRRSGVRELYNYLKNAGTEEFTEEKKHLLAQRGYMLLQSQLMGQMDMEFFREELFRGMKNKDFNLFKFVRDFVAGNKFH